MQEGGLKRAVGGCSMHEFSVNFNLMFFDYFLSSSLDVGWSQIPQHINRENQLVNTREIETLSNFYSWINRQSVIPSQYYRVKLIVSRLKDQFFHWFAYFPTNTSSENWVLHQDIFP